MRVPPRLHCSYKGMALFMTYTAKHYEDQMANGKDCDNVNEPLTGDGLAYATGHSDAMQLRDAQVNVSVLGVGCAHSPCDSVGAICCPVKAMHAHGRAHTHTHAHTHAHTRTYAHMRARTCAH